MGEWRKEKVEESKGRIDGGEWIERERIRGERSEKVREGKKEQGKDRERM